MIPATPLPLRRLPKPTVIGRVGLGVLVLSGVISLAGLPAPADVAHVSTPERRLTVVSFRAVGGTCH